MLAPQRFRLLIAFAALTALTSGCLGAKLEAIADDGWNDTLTTSDAAPSDLAAVDGSTQPDTAETNAEVASPPAIGLVSPAPNAVGVSLAAAVVVQFERLMNEASVEAAFRLAAKDTPVSGSFSWQGSQLTLIPAAPLSGGTQYTISVDKTAVDRDGTPLAGAWLSTFKTGDPPAATSLTIGDPPSSAWVINAGTANTAVLQGSAEPGVTVRLTGPGFVEVVTTADSKGDFVFSNADLALAKIAGLSAPDYLAQPLSFTLENSFGTVLAKASLTVTKDVVAPTAVIESPGDLSEGLPLDQSLLIRFNEVLKATATLQAVTFVELSENPWPASFTATLSSDGTALTVALQDTLFLDTRYRLDLGKVLTDLAGNPLATTQFLLRTYADSRDPNNTPDLVSQQSITLEQPLLTLLLLAESDPIDLYRFVLPASPYGAWKVSASVTAVSPLKPVPEATSDFLNLAFLSEEGEVLHDISPTLPFLPTNVELTRALVSGRPYLVGVAITKPNTRLDYTLSVHASPLDCDASPVWDAYDLNESLPTAKLVGLDQSIDATLCGTTDASDFYLFNLTEAKKVTATLKQTNVTDPEATIRLTYFSVGTGDTYRIAIAPAPLAFTFGPGSYVLEVRKTDPEAALVAYNLNLASSAPCQDDSYDLAPNDDDFPAGAIAVDSGVVTTGVLCQADWDYRKVAVEAGQEISVVVSTPGFFGVKQVRIYQGTNVICGQQDGSGEFVVLSCTAAGSVDHLVAVRTADGDQINYTVTVTVK